ncbi:MAG: hypothetical protein ABI409_09020 [Ramlibacter sp.]
MNQPYPRHHNREPVTTWFVIPLLTVCAILLAMLLLSRPAPFAIEVQAQPTAATPAPYVGSDPSLPAASSVFKDGASYESGPAPETF